MKPEVTAYGMPVAGKRAPVMGCFPGDRSPFRPPPRFSRGVVVPLRRPTADSQLLVAAACDGMRRIFEPGFQLSKAGVMLLDLGSSSAHQGELDLDAPAGRDKSGLLSAIDGLNQRFGKRTVFVGSAGVAESHEWGMRQERRTPQYTTRLSDIPIARA